MADIDLHRLSHALPIYAEEGSYREIIPRTELITILQGGSHQDGALGAINVVQRIFDALGLLDSAELARGNWAFVSFPAYLMARSFLETLALPGQSLFHPGYWKQDGAKSVVVIEEQRRLLAELEGRRVRFNPASDATPIRFVYVAWGLIRLGNEFLLVHREDKSRSDTKNYVFPGGRFTIDDLPEDERNPHVLRRLQGADIEGLSDALGRTLSRELDEELTLRVLTDFIAIPHGNLRPYRKLEGAQNNHAYTEYHIRIFNVALTPDGEARLLDHVAVSENLEWFRLDDLLSPMGRTDGKTAFIDALRNEYADNLQAMLAAVPDSNGTPYRLTGETNLVDIPAAHNRPFRVGKTGKEKEFSIPLTATELALLSTLVAYARGFDVLPASAHVRLLGGGWIKLTTEEALTTALSLTQKLAAALLPMVQMVAGTFARLAIDPAIVFIGEANYQYRLDGYMLHIGLTLPTEPWSRLPGVKKNIELDPTLTLVVRAILSDGSLWKGEKIIEGKDIDREFRDKIDKHLRPIGLRKLIRTSQEDYVIVVPPETA